jgi:hypothetical protein
MSWTNSRLFLVKISRSYSLLPANSISVPGMVEKNERARKEILVAPSTPLFSSLPNSLWRRLFTHCSTWEGGFGYKSRGTEGKSTLTMTLWSEPRRPYASRSPQAQAPAPVAIPTP